MPVTPVPALSLVIPVYNEEAAIEQAVICWADEVGRLGVPFEMLVYDDGSKDRTTEVLRALAERLPALNVHRHDNIGHGPTILRGYHEARGEWIFQTDSDGEMDATAFRRLWEQRERYDFLLGRRSGRDSPLMRRLVTSVSRASVRWLFGKGVTDVNAPFRLMRAEWLRQVLPYVARDTFAPNVILSGLAAQSRARIYEMDVRHTTRQHGRSSLGSLSVLRPAARSFAQTVRAAALAKRKTSA